MNAPEEKREEQQQPDRPPTFEELIVMPLTEAEARIQLANLDIQLAQCQQRRAEVDREIADIATVRAVVLRRVLNPQPTGETTDGSGD